jgi:hypothetical protein
MTASAEEENILVVEINSPNCRITKISKVNFKW